VKIAILVEGKTEIALMPSVRRILNSRLPAGIMPRLKPITCDGRIPKEEKLKRAVEALLSGKDAHDAVIALTDVYTGTKDFNDAADAKKKMRQWVGNNPNFYPHAAQHDFEAWLLPFWPTIQKLAKHNKSVPSGNPEEVNHHKSPSKHIQEIFENGQSPRSYSKTRDGLKI